MTHGLDLAEKRLWMWISRYNDNACERDIDPAIGDKVQIAINMFREAARLEALEEAAKIVDQHGDKQIAVVIRELKGDAALE